MSALLHPLRRLAALQPGAPVLGAGERLLSAASCIESIGRIARTLGGDAGSTCVASRLDNGVDAVLLDLATRDAGVVHAALPPYFSPAQVAHALERCTPAWLALPAGERPSTQWVPHELPDLPTLTLWRRPTPDAPQWPGGTACITFTSGSTGQPRGVCLAETQLAAVAGSLAEAFSGLDPRRHMCALPVSTLLEAVGVYAALGNGAEIRAPALAELGYSGASGLQPARLYAALAHHRPHSVILVPQLLEGLLDAIDRLGPLPFEARVVAVGGAKVGARLLARAAAAGLPVFEGYGLTEAGSVVALNRPGASRPGTVGRPLPHVRVTVAGDGELWIDGSGHLGYLGEPPPPPGPWPTGDLGAVDADGFLHLDGRKRSVFVTAYGRNVSPEWIEAELESSPAIAQAVVTGEARPWNLALVVPANPDVCDAELRVELQRINAGLPDYARIGALLRVDAAFTAANGCATGNGRVRRDRVLAAFADRIAARQAMSPDLDPTPIPAEESA